MNDAEPPRHEFEEPSEVADPTARRCSRSSSSDARTIHAWARSGYMPCVKIGRHRRFVRDDVLDFIERQRPPR
jgi:excisionase family DNA binding protein